MNRRAASCGEFDPRRSHLRLGANRQRRSLVRAQNHMAIHPRSGHAGFFTSTVKMKQESPQAEIKVKVLPRSSRSEILMRDDLLTVKVSAPPVEGAANKALIALLAEKLGVSKSSIDILSGKKSRLKLLRVHGLSLQQVKAILGEGQQGA